MKLPILSATLLAMTAGLFAVGAQASDDYFRRSTDLAPRAEWASISSLVQKFEAQGYTIHEIDTERGAYEIEMVDANGLRVEGYFHPVTLEPLKRQRWDD